MIIINYINKKKTLYNNTVPVWSIPPVFKTHMKVQIKGGYAVYNFCPKNTERCHKSLTEEPNQKLTKMVVRILKLNVFPAVSCECTGI